MTKWRIAILDWAVGYWTRQVANDEQRLVRSRQRLAQARAMRASVG